MELVQEKRSGGQRWTAQRLTLMGLFTAVLCVSSYIVIPLPFTAVSITAQTMVVNLIGMILAPADTAIVFLVWICLGLAGAPVFSGGGGGAAKLLGPTGGYIIGYLAAAVLISLFCRKVKGMGKQTLFLIVVGIPVIYLFGGAWMKISMRLTWPAVVIQGVIPFIPMDVAKCIGAAALAKALRRALPVPA
ncbi:MAG TPA: biotin transporter BioY [Candidatus Lachnoclostridium avicola]|nr:biotin transporter BioY [Candidatus Lachnoclostridium avicola]